MTSKVTAMVNKGGLSCDVTVDDIPMARVFLKTEAGDEGKRDIIDHIAWCINHVAREVHETGTEP